MAKVFKMNREITENDVTGKAFLTFLAPITYTDLKNNQPVKVSLDFLDKEIWNIVPGKEYDNFVKGSVVFDYSKSTLFSWKVNAALEILDQLSKAILSKSTVYFGKDVNVSVVEWHLVAIGNTIISNCMLEIDCPWDSFLNTFPTMRDPFSKDLRDILAKYLCRLQPPDTLLNFPYFHVVVSGELIEKVDRPYLGTSFRRILYPENNSPMMSMSPHPQEFIFLGYGFSLLLSPNSPEKRTHQILPLLEYTSSLYRELATNSNFAQNKIVDNGFKTDVELHKMKNEISIKYHELVSPTFTYTHEMLVLRDGLLKTWRVDQLLTRANFLVTQLDLQITEWRERQEKQWARRINLFLFVITVSTIISVIYDATMLAKAFDFLQTTAVEAWENLQSR
ncbi:MAG: hypothetical protein GY705_31380 [Bacteroidetes bacterium]|nr:hypothetical protein [Bacteroidota bacterium]